MGDNLEKLRFVFEFIAFRSKMSKHFVLRIIYDSKEEERVITESEQRTAKALGEIKNGEITRKDHKSTNIIIVDDPTSVVTSEEGIIIKPQNK